MSKFIRYGPSRVVMVTGEMRRELLGMGFDIAHRGREQLTAYLLHRAPKRVIQCATQTGWAGPERQAFVLPYAVIGPQVDSVTYQSDHAGGDEYSTLGTLKGWQAGTAALAAWKSHAGAGGLATTYGVTGWDKGEAIHVAVVGLRLWLGMQDGRTTDAEGPQVTDQVTAFIDRHGDSRFSDADAEPQHSPPVRDRAGWWRDRDGGRPLDF